VRQKTKDPDVVIPRPNAGSCCTGALSVLAPVPILQNLTTLYSPIIRTLFTSRAVRAILYTKHPYHQTRLPAFLPKELSYIPDQRVTAVPSPSRKLLYLSTLPNRNRYYRSKENDGPDYRRGRYCCCKLALGARSAS
jgi:hypothetical protein